MTCLGFTERWLRDVHNWYARTEWRMRNNSTVRHANWGSQWPDQARYRYLTGYVLPPAFFIGFLISIQRVGRQSEDTKGVALEIYFSILQASNRDNLDEVG